MGFGWQEIDKTLDLGYIRVAGLHRECKPVILFDPPNFCPRTMTHMWLWLEDYRCGCGWRTTDAVVVRGLQMWL